MRSSAANASDKTMSSGNHTGKSTNSSNSHGHRQSITCPPSKVWTSRILLLIVLSGAAVVLGYGSNRLLSDSETTLANEQFESISERALSAARENTLRKNYGTIQLASILSFAFPDAETWPLINLNGYETIAANVIQATVGATLAVCPFVTPDQLSEFEDFAYDVVFASKKYPSEIGESSFGRGVYGLDFSLNNTDFRFRETDGSTTWGSPNKVFTPFLLHSKGPTSILMGNYRTFEARGRLIDDMIACAKERAASENASSIECSILDPLIIPSRGPSSVTMQPIYPSNNNTVLTGLITSAIAWDEVLENIFADETSGIDCVLGTETLVYTYRISNGVAAFIGEGDLHAAEFSGYRESIALTTPGMFSEKSPTYTLTLYPTDEFFEVYSTSNPVVATVGSVCIIVFTSLLFLIYDFFVRQESHHKLVILEAKRQFIRFVSHEVRTPLNAACLGLRLIHEELEGSAVMANDGEEQTSSADVDGVQKGKVEEWLMLSNEISSNTQAAVDVLNDLLNYDKIESGTLSLEFTVLKFWQLIEDTVGEFKLSAMQQGINLLVDFSGLAAALSPECISDEECDVGPPLTAAMLSKSMECHVVGDRIRLIQVLRNLVSNGLKFTPERGNLTVRVSWKPPCLSESEPTMTRFKLSVGEQVSYDIGGSVHIEVIDTGAGMSPEQVSELFQAGVQFNVNVLQAGQGSGLGLYISKGIVEQHGGTLAVSSEGLGRGSTFTCTLPLHRIPTDVEDEGTSRTTRPSDTPAKLKEMLPLRVLVVEDSAMNRKMLVRLLQKRGHSVFEAVDGQEAIDKVEQAMTDGSAFDTILMDYEMPVMNGPESSRGIRDLGCDSFIVGVTGNLMEDDVNYFKECGANTVLPKPLDFTELEHLWVEYGVADEDKMLEGQFCEV